MKTELENQKKVKDLAPKWEYMVKKYRFSFISEAELNAYGSKGWELCSFIINPANGGAAAYFKRLVVQ